MEASIPPKFVGAVEDEWQMYSDNPEDYNITSPIGFGASSIVYLAYYSPSEKKDKMPCALKVLDLDSLPSKSLNLLVRETQLMSLSKHPNVLRVRGSWIDGHRLHIALRLMNRGSAADVMQYGWPGGMEEEVVKCILRQALEGLNYLHVNGLIHRDVKAANLLIDDDGTVLVGDLGVAASLCDDDSSQGRDSRKLVNFNPVDVASTTTRSPSSSRTPARGKRKSFVGTPCWMAPEIISGKQYDASADIWSFAITAIELTQGRAPRSREPPHKVLFQTVQEAPPAFSRNTNSHHYSKAFKEIVESCLVKDPSARPTAEQLLQTPFFKGAKKKGYLVNAILDGLPPLVDRQARRRMPSHPTGSSAGSWDFTVLATPTNSLRGSRLSNGTYVSGIFAIDGHPSDNPSTENVASSSASGRATSRKSETQEASSFSSSADISPPLETVLTPPIPIAVTSSKSAIPSQSPSTFSSSSATMHSSDASFVPSSSTSAPRVWRKPSERRPSALGDKQHSSFRKGITKFFDQKLSKSPGS